MDSSPLSGSEDLCAYVGLWGRIVLQIPSLCLRALSDASPKNSLSSSIIVVF